MNVAKKWHVIQRWPQALNCFAILWEIDSLSRRGNRNYESRLHNLLDTSAQPPDELAGRLDLLPI